MHELGISHRDLKPENVLLKNGMVRICDVGSSKVLDDPMYSTNPMNTPYVVSRYYRAPELILGTNRYNHSIDIWAAGCILFELMTKRPLFPGDSEGLQLIEMQQIIGKPSEKQLMNLDQEMQIQPSMMKMLGSVIDLEKNDRVKMVDLLSLCPGYKNKDVLGVNAYTDKDI